MSKASVVLVMIISAVVGAVIGVVLAAGVLGRAIDTQIETRLASYGGPAAQPVSIGGSSSGEAAASGSGGNPVLASALDAEEQSVIRVFKNVSPSVVHVSTIQYYRDMFFFRVVPQEGTGSGFIISQDGYILTNNHVVQGAQEITVRLAGGDEYPAQLVGTDQLTDLAVLRITGVDIAPEWVAPLGDSDALQVGQRAIAIGNPFGLDSTVTEGVVSALNRPVNTEDTSFDNMIQTDASINPGNSGGPLIDSSGNVIGINTVILSRSGGSQGIGFAIPINSARKVIDDLIQYGGVRRPQLGFTGLTLYPDLANFLKLPVNYGVLVQEVQPGSAADKAGMRGGRDMRTFGDPFRRFSLYIDGDIIIEFNGEKVTEIARLADEIHRMELGTQVSLAVMRGGQRVDLTMTLSE